MGVSRKLATFAFAAVLALGIALALRTTRDPRPDPGVLREKENRDTAAAARGELDRAESAARDASTARDAVVTTPLRVHGTLTRGGLPVAGRRVVLFDPQTQGTATVSTDATGSWSFPASPQSYLVKVPFADEDQSAALTRSAVVRDESVQLHLELGTLVVHAHVVDASTSLGLDDVLVHCDAGLVERDATTDSAGRARFEDLRTRAIQATATRRGYRPGNAMARITETQTVLDLEFALEPWGAIDVTFVGSQGEELWPIAMPLNLTSVHSKLSWSPSWSMPIGAWDNPTPDDSAFRQHSWDLPPGTYRLVVADSIEDGCERYAPFAPLNVEIDAHGGTVTRTRVRAQRRAVVQVRVAPLHEENARTVLLVERHDHDHGTRRVLPAQWRTELVRLDGVVFHGYLIPGTYSLSFSQDGRRHVETLVVDTADIARSFRMPW